MYEKMNNRIILVGPAASGKDYARFIFEKRGFSYGVPHTTRPIRSGEKQGETYHYVDEHTFMNIANNKDFYEFSTFNKWMYGITKSSFYNDKVFIMSPGAISKILPTDRKTSLIIYYDINIDIRKERLIKRIDADTVERRLNSDQIDFENFTDFDIRITNHNF